MNSCARVKVYAFHRCIAAPEILKHAAVFRCTQSDPSQSEVGQVLGVIGVPLYRCIDVSIYRCVQGYPSHPIAEGPADDGNSELCIKLTGKPFICLSVIFLAVP